MGDKVAIKSKMSEVVEFLKPFDLLTFEAFNPGSKTEHTMHGLISLPRGKWVDKELLEKLRGLPPNFSIKIDPDTLL
jgi:hypothetical protein